MLRLSSGARQTALLAALNRAVETMEIVPFDAAAAAGIRARLEGLGIGIGLLDVQIAGVALAQSATLVTRNIREFSKVPLLGLQNWHDSLG